MKLPNANANSSYGVISSFHSGRITLERVYPTPLCFVVRTFTTQSSTNTTTHGVHNGQDTNRAIRSKLEEHAKKCYETWKHIDMNDGKLPDDFKTFDDWKQSSGCISTSVGSYPRMTYPSPAFHTTVFALSGVVIWRLRVDISRRVNVNTLTSRLCVTPSTPSQMTCSTAWPPTENVVTHQRRNAPTSVSPARCQFPRKCARVRAWKRIMRRKIAQRAR